MEGKFAKSKRKLVTQHCHDASRRMKETNWAIQSHRAELMDRFVEELRVAITAGGESIDEEFLENLLRWEEPYMRTTLFGLGPNRRYLD